MKIPQHIAFIPDGNGRWAQQHHLPVKTGHHKGVEVLETILDACYDQGVKVVTVYAFSSENWKRSPDEKTVLFSLIDFFLTRKLPKLIQKNIKIKIIGSVTDFPASTRTHIKQAEQATQHFTNATLQIALGYGGREEIIRAVNRFTQAVQNGKHTLADLDEACFSQYLDTAGTTDPDLIVRTSGEYRISNFLLFQMAYSELYFTPTLWPDFTPTELTQILKNFASRERRFGDRLEYTQKSQVGS